MKRLTLIGILVLISLYVNCFTQDLINPPVLQIVRNDNTNIFRGSLNFQLGWNWGSPGAKLDSAMSINSYHHMNLDVTGYARGMNVIQQISNTICGGRNADNVLNALCLYLEPTIIVDTNQTPKPGFIN